jgi:hypothetical protein
MGQIIPGEAGDDCVRKRSGAGSLYREDSPAHPSTAERLAAGGMSDSVNSEKAGPRKGAADYILMAGPPQNSKRPLVLAFS